MIFPKHQNIKSPSYVDEFGLQWTVVGWHNHKSMTRYLIRYTKPNTYKRWTHALVDRSRVPHSLLQDFVESQELDLCNPDNRGGIGVKPQNILRVLDMAWYCGNITDESLNDARSTQQTKFNDFFVQLLWKDANGEIHTTWEFAETLVEIMGEALSLSLLGKWVIDVDLRHNQLLSDSPTKAIWPELGFAGWQHL